MVAGGRPGTVFEHGLGFGDVRPEPAVNLLTLPVAEVVQGQQAVRRRRMTLLVEEQGRRPVPPPVDRALGGCG